ncbi:unnamed protein product [Scytosiphon promiscuus]
MFFRERGLSKWEVRKVLAVVRRDPELVSDIGALAARMQAVADLLEAAGSWYPPADRLVAEVVSRRGTSPKDPPEGAPRPSSPQAPDRRRSSPPAAAAGDRSVGGTCDERISGREGLTNTGQQQEDSDVSFPAATTGGGKPRGGPASAAEDSAGDCQTGGTRDPGGRNRGHLHGSRPANAVAPATAATPAAASAAVADAAAAPREGRRRRRRRRSAGTDEEEQETAGGEEDAARLHAYQVVSSEPRLLLLVRPGSEPDLLARRLRFLLDALPALRGTDDCCRCCWNAGTPLRRAAPLLAIESATLGRRLAGLAEMLPPSVDVQTIVNQAPLLLRQSTEALSEALVNTERLIPGLRMDRMLRSAPHLLVQPSDVVERRLTHLREVLGLTPSPTLERMRMATEAQQITTTGATGGGGGGGRRLSRFANAFPQILTMDPNTVQAKIEGLEDLLPGVDGLAVVSSRPQLLGFDVWRNVSLKVSTLRELMTRARVRQGPILPRHKQQRQQPQQPQQEQGQEGMHQDGPRAEGQRRRGRGRRRITLPSDSTASDDLAAAVTRCPSLLTLSSDTTMRKVQEFQAALPSGLDARTIVAKEPRVLALDMGSTVPRKLEDLMRAFGEHASDAETAAATSDRNGRDKADVDGAAIRGEEAGGAAPAPMAPIADGVMAQVLRYFPNALRFEPATLAGKLEALQRAGLSPETALEVVGGAPRCLSVAEGTLERRVSALREAFPSIPLSRLLGEAPCLLQNRIDAAAKTEVLRELFPSLDPVRLVEGAPMLLALSRGTLRVKSDAWRHVLEGRVDVPWEQAIAEFPRLLCQGLGRAARIAFLLSAADDERTSSATVKASGDVVVVSTASPSDFGVSDVGGHHSKTATAACGGRIGDGDDGGGDGYGGGNGGNASVGVGKRMPAAAAYREICRRVSDFEEAHPGYPAFLESLLIGVTLDGSVGIGSPGEPEKEKAAGDFVSFVPPAAGRVLSHKGADAGAGAAGEAGVLGEGGAATVASSAATEAAALSPFAAAAAAAASDVEAERVARPQLLVVAAHEGGEQQPRQHRHHDHHQAPRDQPPASQAARIATCSAPTGSFSPTALSTPIPPVRNEKALSAAMAEAARGPGGGREAAAILFSDESAPPPR